MRHRHLATVGAKPHRKLKIFVRQDKDVYQKKQKYWETKVNRLTEAKKCTISFTESG